ncbi:chitinase-like protein 1 [Silene latifolia]|uniref:chitinase-like protein 1 n=1 Tax=Silene latifolia TaxID=37657 RepID=UPI003D76D598
MTSKKSPKMVLFLALTLALMAEIAVSDLSEVVKMKTVKGQKVCTKGWECEQWSKYCCNGTISDYFQVYQFEDLYKYRNWPTAHAVGFWDYQAFIVASAGYQHLGFGTTGGNLMSMLEVAAFLGHVGAKTSCGYNVVEGGPSAWGLCYNRELSPSQDYCDDFYKYRYPCTPGVAYFGRGALPIYWNVNYGATGEALKVDLLNHPEYIEQNATLAFQAAIWRWMTPIKKGQPSAHQAFCGEAAGWKPTKNDTLSHRITGFGTTMNVLYGDQLCGQGEDVQEMNTIITHYLYYADKMGIGREKAGLNVSCGQQKAFNPTKSTPATAAL